MNNISKEIIEQQAAALLGLKQKTMGKTQVRQEFLPLVDELSHSAKTVEITDHEKPVAILIGYSHWSDVISKLAKFMKPEPRVPKIDLMGSGKIVGDLEAGSKRAAKRFKMAIEKSAHKLRGA